jgi:transposase
MIATERERGDVALARWLWHRDQKTIDPRRLVFVDETGTATNMSPLYGWGPKGERVIGSASYGHWKRTTFVGGLTLDGFIAPMVIEQAMNGVTFEAWVEQFLIPEMPKNAVVVMDNLSAHKGEKVREVIEAAGGEVLYLPPYSPDLNPIEQAFAKLKHWLRTAQETTTENLWSMIGTILDHFKPDECARYFQNSGYRSV